MKNKTLISLSVLSLSLLQACGGGGGGGGVPMGAVPSAVSAGADKDTTSPVVADSGSVSAPFAPNANARYQLLSFGQSFGALSQSEQAASGAMVRLNDNTLTGASATKDIHGDASFAIGRWVAGTVTRSSGAETLSGTDNRAFHYTVFNALPQLPVEGSPQCDAGVFTTPTYLGGSTGSAAAAATGLARGSAGLAFGDGAAQVSGSLSVAVGDASASVSLNSSVVSPTSTSITGSLLGGGAGAAIQLGDAGAGVYLVAAGYVAVLPSGARYTGTAMFRCI